MVRRTRALLFVFVLASVSALQNTRAENTYHGFVSTTAGFTAAWFRLGMNNYELGIVPGALVFNKMIFADRLYAALGPAYSVGETDATLGFFASVGFDLPLFWVFNFRGELYALGDVAGVVRGGGLLGAEVRF